MNNDLVVLESLPLGGVEPISVLRVLRDHFKKRSVTLCRSSQSEGDGFLPSQSMIGIDPDEIIQIQGQDPFRILEAKLRERMVPRVAELPFFQGGMFGYVSYDAVRYLEPSLLQAQLFKNQKAFYDAEVVFYKNYIVFDHVKKTAYLYHTEKSKDRATRMSELAALEKIALQAVALNEKQFSKIETQKVVEMPIEQMKSKLGRDAYIAGVKKLKHHILEGDIFQAVLSDQFSVPFHSDPLDLFSILAQISPAPYQFYFSIDDRAYLGASPEMLLKSVGEDIETHPIAGTRPRGKTEQEEKQLEEELLSNEKEKAEHLMLVDLARNDVGRVAKPGSVHVDSFMKLRKFGGVMHLVSRVCGKISGNISAVRALASSFPAGTLSGAPKIRAMDLITEIEKAPRGFYGGAFIAASFNGDLDSCISIRSISIENGCAKVQAGAGIVADSIPEMEYEEVQHKSRLTRRALTIALAEAGARP